MPAALANHLWQSTHFCLAMMAFAVTLHASSVTARYRLLFAASVKFLLPLSLLHALGSWLGFPVAHVADPPPAMLVDLVSRARPWISPVHTADLIAVPSSVMIMLAGLWIAGASCAVHRRVARFVPGPPRDLASRLRELPAHLPRLAEVVFWFHPFVWLSGRTLARERVRVRAYFEAGLEPAPPGFARAALMTAFALAVVVGSVLAGAIDDRTWRRELLAANALSLREAPIAMTHAAPGMGMRARVIADRHGVLIRNINMQDLVALVYGVNHFSVWGEQLGAPFHDPEQRPWLTSPRYDLRVEGPVREPREFDAYSLRQPVTKLLASRFGITINVNSACQPPCGRYNLALPEDPLAPL